MSTQASWKYVNLFKVLYGIYTHLWFKGCSVYNLFLYFLTWGLFLLDQVRFEGVPLVLLLLFFFFLISNVRNFIKKTNQVHWKCTTVAQIENPDYNNL